MSLIEKQALPTDGSIYKGSAPFTGKVVLNRKLVTQRLADDVRHIIIDIHNSGMKYVEGQSVGVIPPGTRENGKPNVLRLYSIASCRNGDDGYPNTLSLTVKRTIYLDESGCEVRGLCSNYLCDLSPGDPVKLTGPTGKLLLMPNHHHLNMYLIATGTGIAPFLGFLNYYASIEPDLVPSVELYFGVKTGKDLLYMNDCGDELQNIRLPKFNMITALSREQKTDAGEKMYVQHRLQENFDAVWDAVVNDRACFYICGLKGMEKGIEKLFENACGKTGRDWKTFKKELRKDGRWNVEVY